MINADQCLLLQPTLERAEHLAIETTDPGAVLQLAEVDRLPRTMRHRDFRPRSDARTAQSSRGARGCTRSATRTFGHYHAAACGYDCTNGRGDEVYRWRRLDIMANLRPGTDLGCGRLRKFRNRLSRSPRRRPEPPRVFRSRWLDGSPSSLEWPAGRTAYLQKAAAVLSYLALTETKRESRERLVGLLWSRSDEEKARGSLRQVIRELRSRPSRMPAYGRVCRGQALDPSRSRNGRGRYRKHHPTGGNRERPSAVAQCSAA